MMSAFEPRFLSHADLAALTGRVRAAAQKRALDGMGIAYFVRPDGRPVVCAEALLPAAPAHATPAEPNWAALPRT